MKKLILSAMCLAVVASTAALLLTGCEEADGLETVLVTPSKTEMTTRDNSVWLTASFPGITKQDGDSTNDTTTVDVGTPVGQDDILHLPLEWEVTNPSLGGIFGSAGTSALYVRSPITGVNTVVVRDQYGNEGYATIRQMVEQYRLELTALSGSASNNLSAAYIPSDQVTATIRVSSAIGGDGPTAPFTWSVLFPTRGYIQAGQGSDTVVFRATTQSGYNVVQCTDAYGVTGTIVVQVGATASSSSSGGSPTINTSISLDANPDQIENGDNTSVVTITSTSTPSYSWTVTPQDAGNSAVFQEADTSGLSQVTVQTNGDGDYTVSVTDGLGRSGQITVTQE